ncbi:androgen-dependent TFPI-regulating protein [Austrofundulus limnaeus]|uniref:Androgen-dependent TFPI-regulating protein n=1 Tax=Austrofundulus limnaeus TaxID=52670 RepID=A0A2I4AKI0_AUSLI|nr:PREDICTED: androgen-dependent TFPI-regulating protein-like [Austrofundulus limnaeus]
MTWTLRTVYHVAGFSWYALVVKYLAAKDGDQLPTGIFVYGGPWKYLTFLNLLLQMTFFGLAAVTDLQQEKTGSALLKWKDLLFSVFAFPVGMFVVLLFWTIYAIDRELVYPAALDSFFPPWINHAMHTFVFPVLLGELLLQPHAYPKTKLSALAALGLVGLAYLSWIIWVYASVGIWVYPLLGYFSAAGLMGFFLFNMSVVTLLYLLGQELDGRLWRKSEAKTGLS